MVVDNCNKNQEISKQVDSTGKRYNRYNIYVFFVENCVEYEQTV